MKAIIPIVSATCALMLLSVISEANPAVNERLQKALKKYPEADTNKDGVLTMQEAKAYRNKKGKKKHVVQEAVDDGKKYPQPADLKEGARCLFMGHSFFIPVAKQFDMIAQANDFPKHHVNFVMSGGGGGAPGRLWQSQIHQQSGRNFLETGNVHLLGMTYYSEENCKVEDYQRWIDLAVKHNPKVRVFIGLCWPDFPSQKDPKTYDTYLQKLQGQLVKTVTKLREMYPAQDIIFVNYGRVSVELRYKLEAGNLPGINQLTERSSNALYRDEKGHAGPLITELAALTWLEHIYKAEVSQLKAASNQTEAGKTVLSAVKAFNKPFQ